MFQAFNLMPNLTAMENVMLPLLIRRHPMGEARIRAHALLERVGLAERLQHRPGELSGGEQQRVALARALVGEPAVLLADEPTGNLDSKTSVEILAIFQRLNRDNGITVVLVTHEPDIAAYASRTILFRDGHILKDERISTPRDATTEVAALP